MLLLDTDGAPVIADVVAYQGSRKSDARPVRDACIGVLGGIGFVLDRRH